MPVPLQLIRWRVGAKNNKPQYAIRQSKNLLDSVRFGTLRWMWNVKRNERMVHKWIEETGKVKLDLHKKQGSSTLRTMPDKKPPGKTSLKTTKLWLGQTRIQVKRGLSCGKSKIKCRTQQCERCGRSAETQHEGKAERCEPENATPFQKAVKNTIKDLNAPEDWKHNQVYSDIEKHFEETHEEDASNSLPRKCKVESYNKRIGNIVGLCSKYKKTGAGTNQKGST